jgi:lipopolysaccharide export system protein LptA
MRVPTTMLRIDHIRRPVLAASAAALLAITAGYAAAQTNTQTSAFKGLKMSGNEPIQIESDKLEVREKENVAVFSGNVAVVQGTTLLKAGKLTVYYVAGADTSASGSTAIDHLEVEDTVYVKSDDQTATGDKGSFDMKTEMLVLTGDEVVLTQGKSVLVGCKLTVNMKTSQANFEGCAKTGGRVKTLLDQNDKPKPAQPSQ